MWRALEDAQAAGKIKAIGVSNFLQDDLDNLLSTCRVKPMINQILLHIGCTDFELLEFCRAQGIQVEAYSPIAHGEALKNSVIVDMAKKYGVSPAQLCIRYVFSLKRWLSLKPQMRGIWRITLLLILNCLKWTWKSSSIWIPFGITASSAFFRCSAENSRHNESNSYLKKNEQTGNRTGLFILLLYPI